MNANVLTLRSKLIAAFFTMALPTVGDAVAAFTVAP